MTNTKLNRFKDSEMRFKDLTGQDILKAMQVHFNGSIVGEEQKKEYEPLLKRKLTFGESIDVFNVLLNPIVVADNEVRKHNDVMDYLLNKKLKLTEEEWDEAEKTVDKLNEKKRKEAAEALQKAVKAKAQETMKKETKKGVTK